MQVLTGNVFGVDTIAGSGSLPYLRLDRLGAQREVTQTFVGDTLTALNWLDAGQYKLTISGYVSSTYNYVGSTGGALSGGLRLQATAVPEPSTSAFWALGGVMLALGARRRRLLRQR